MYKPGLDDSGVNLSQQQAASLSDSGLSGIGGHSSVSVEQGLKNSGYIYGTAPLTSSNSAQKKVDSGINTINNIDTANANKKAATDINQLGAKNGTNYYTLGTDVYDQNTGKIVGTTDEVANGTFNPTKSTPKPGTMPNGATPTTGNAANDATFKQNNSYIDGEISGVESTFNSLYSSLEDGSQDLIDSIKATYKSRAEGQKNLNISASNAVQIAGSRSGRDRYASEIQTGILSAEESAGLKRLSDIGVEEAKLIAEAKLAKTQNQWKMFNEKVGLLAGLHKDKIQALKDQLTIQKDSADLADKASKSALDKAKEVAAAGGEMSDDAKAELDGIYGEGFSTKYTALQKKLADNAILKDDAETQKTIAELRKEIPEGQTLTIGDTTYTHLPSSDGNVHYEQTDNAGNTTYVTLNKEGKIVATVNAGKIGKAAKVAGGAGGGAGADYAATLAALTAAKNPPTGAGAAIAKGAGYEPPSFIDTYKTLRLATKDKASFDKNFSYMLDPNDPASTALIKETATAKWEEQIGVWQELSSAEGQAMTEEQKKAYVQSQGFNPSDFNLD